MVKNIIPFFQQFAQKAMNHLLKLDPEVQKEFLMFNGKVLKIEIVDLQKIVFLHITDQGLELLDHYDGTVHAAVKGTAVALSQLGASKSLSLEGDMEFMQQLMHLTKKYHFDLGALLASGFGDVLGQQVENGLRNIAGWAKSSSEKMGWNISAFLTDEIRLVTTREEMTLFSNEVDALRDAVERVSVKINQRKGDL